MAIKNNPPEEVAWDRAEDDYCERGTWHAAPINLADSECRITVDKELDIEGCLTKRRSRVCLSW